MVDSCMASEIPVPIAASVVNSIQVSAIAAMAKVFRILLFFRLRGKLQVDFTENNEDYVTPIVDARLENGARVNAG